MNKKRKYSKPKPKVNLKDVYRSIVSIRTDIILGDLQDPELIEQELACLEEYILEGDKIMLGADKINYYKPEDFEALDKLLNPNKFLQDMIRVGELEEISKNYCEDCTLLCHNAVAWAIKQLADTLFFYNIEIVTGRFVWGEHSWLKCGDYYIDLTLAQFRPEAPKIAITLVGEGEKNGYRPLNVYSPREYIQSLRSEV